MLNNSKFCRRCPDIVILSVAIVILSVAIVILSVAKDLAFLAKNVDPSLRPG
jgi:hypothetical protein